MDPPVTTQPRPLISRPLTPEAFAPFGVVVQPQAGDAPWCPGDAELLFDGGPPRLYLMTLSRRGLSVHELARHHLVSQALGAVDDLPWWLVVARPDHPADEALDPARDLWAFRIPPRQLVVLHPGTWHAGPLFEGAAERVFLNLECRSTNSDDRLLRPLLGHGHCTVQVDAEALMPETPS